MKNLMQSIKSKVSKRQKGVTLIEYALIASLIAVLSIAVLTSIGINLEGAFQQVLDALS
jgi:pilus assembly protein Flp/PilA